VLFYLSTGDPVLLLPADQYHRLTEESGLRARNLMLAEGDTAAAATIDELLEDLRDIEVIFDQAVAERQAGNSDASGETTVTTVPRLLEMESEFERLAGSERRLVLDLQQRSDETSQLSFWMLIASGAVGLWFATSVSLLVARSIIRPLNKLESSAIAVAEGDLDARAPESGPRELARLGSSLNRMTATVLDASKRAELEADRARAQGALQLRLDQLQAIYRLTDKLSRAEDVDEIYGEALSSAEGTLSADRSAILLFDEEGVMRFRASQGLSDAYRGAVEGHSPWSPGEKAPEPVLIGDVSQEESLNGLLEVIEGEGIAALAFFPLMEQGQLIGKLMIYYDQPHEFSDDEVQLAQTITSHVAFAIRRRSSDERIRELAYHDELTGLPNRLLFQDRFAQAKAQARRDERGLAIGSLDLDRLKAINDTRGHGAGDEAIKFTASLARESCRAVDGVGRYGGDEFVFVLPATEVQQATIFAERFRERFELDRPGRLAFEHTLTVSLGVAQWNTATMRSSECLVKRADSALYQAKVRGRNRVAVDDADRAAA
jgi:diguanylate cyclase (GGDEF)-like protein